MHIRYGYRIEIVCDQPTALVALLDVHPSRRHDLVRPDEMGATAALDARLPIEVSRHIDPFGNIRRRLIAPAGGVLLQLEGLIRDSGQPDPVEPTARQAAPDEVPDDVLGYLLGSRYCETDKLGDLAWSLFGHYPPGWSRVQAVVDFVHNHLTFGYAFARHTRTAAEAFQERIGVCRDFAHLAIALCRCLNIPARYCNGYLGDIGVPPNPAPMDFNAWFEAWLGDRWYTFDARHNQPRIGRILIARGRDAADVPMINSFGPHWLRHFEVITEEVPEPKSDAAAPDARRPGLGRELATSHIAA